MGNSRTKLVAGAAGLVLLLSACGSGSDSPAESSGTPGGSASASGSGSATESPAPQGNDEIIEANGTEPQNPLLPANTNETGGGRVMSLLFRGLVRYDAEGKSQMEAAESITTEDAVTFTVKLKPNQVFSDGTPLTSDSFIDAWNYGALLTNAQANSYFFEPIEGYADVSPSGEGATPTAETMKGLVKVDDLTFTIKLSAPMSSFPLRLGYTAFYPMPKSAYADMKAFGEKPIGNGPYKLEKWEHNKSISVVKNEKYTGGDMPLNGGVNLTFFTTPEAGWTELQGGNLDVIDMVPTAELGNFQEDLGERAIIQPAGIFQSISFPMYTPEYQGEKGAKLRMALSMGFDRAKITKNIFNDTRIPAKDFSSPVVTGYDEALCGDLCTFNPEKAKQLLQEAGGFPGTLQLAYNTDGGHKDWVEAWCNEIKNNLGVPCEGKAYPDFKSLLADRDAKTMGKVLWRSGWQMDYPALENFLGPLYATGAGSNDGAYSNKAFDDKLKEAGSATSEEESVKLYQEAEKMLLADPPVIPLWYSTANGAFGEKVQNVKFDVFSTPIYHLITKSA